MADLPASAQSDDPVGPETQDDEPMQYEAMDMEPPEPAVDPYAAALQAAQSIATSLAEQQGRTIDMGVGGG